MFQNMRSEYCSKRSIRKLREVMRVGIGDDPRCPMRYAALPGDVHIYIPVKCTWIACRLPDFAPSVPRPETDSASARSDIQ